MTLMSDEWYDALAARYLPDLHELNPRPPMADHPDPGVPPDAPAVPMYLPIQEADPKPWWGSRGIWGALAVITSQLAAMIGYHLDAPALTEILFQAAGLAGGILALVGRIGAEQPIRPPV